MVDCSGSISTEKFCRSGRFGDRINSFVNLDVVLVVVVDDVDDEGSMVFMVVN